MHEEVRYLVRSLFDTADIDRVCYTDLVLWIGVDNMKEFGLYVWSQIRVALSILSIGTLILASACWFSLGL